MYDDATAMRLDGRLDSGPTWSDLIRPARLTRRAAACKPREALAEASGPAAEPPMRSLLRRLLAEEHGVLLARARKLCRNDQDARDLVQATAVRVLERSDRFTPGEHGRGWLATVLSNLFIDRCRRESRRRPVEALEPDQIAAPVDDDAPEPRWSRVTPAELRAALDRLDPPSRQVFELFELEQRSYIEIAERLGIAKNTVGTRLIRARAKLKKMLAGEPDELEAGE